MKNFKSSLVSLLALGLMFSGASFAQQDRQDQELGQQKQPSQQQEQAKKQKEHKQQQAKRNQARTIQGTVVATKDVDIKGTQQKNKVALIDLKDGRRLVTDLGNQETLKDLKLEKGTEVSITGKPARIGDRLVLVATDIQVGEQKVDIARQRPDQQRQPAAADQQQHEKHKDMQYKKEQQPQQDRGQ